MANLQGLVKPIFNSSLTSFTPQPIFVHELLAERASSRDSPTLSVAADCRRGFKGTVMKKAGSQGEVLGLKGGSTQ